MFDIIFRKVPAMALLSMKSNERDIIASDIAKKINCTNSHLLKLLKSMKNNELIYSEKNGRINILTLTKKGQLVVSHIEELKKIFEETL